MVCPICVSNHTNYFAKKNNYVFYRCCSCKTIFLPVLPSPKQLNTYYAKQFSYSDGLQNERVIRRRSQTILSCIKQYTPYAKTVCDVGSGFGFFLDEAHHRGYKTIGIEPSRGLATYSKTHYGIAAFIGELKEYVSSIKKQFDIVTCIHVIEHVNNPKEFISLLLRLVKPGGLLYLETPNSDSHLLYAEKENYTFLIPPDHLWLFSKDSMRYLLPENTEIICVSTYSNSEHFMGIIKRIIKNLIAKRRKARGVYPELRRRARFFSALGGSDDKIHIKTNLKLTSLKKRLSYFLFDRLLAPVFTGSLNINHKGSILELYIKKK